MNTAILGPEAGRAERLDEEMNAAVQLRAKMTAPTTRTLIAMNVGRKSARHDRKLEEYFLDEC